MTLYPTRVTLHVALAGTAMVVSGVALHRAPPAAFGGAVLLAIALGRALSLVGGTRLRRAGFEMVWGHPERVIRVARGDATVLRIELRNRGRERVRAASLRVIASSLLDIEAIPPVIDLPPASSVVLELAMVGTRVGRWGLHGMALELRAMPLGGEGLYEVPLVFSNPMGVEVQPHALGTLLRSPRGGRSGRVAMTGRPQPGSGEGDELRELRDHVPGDPFKRMAWRATARRGRLIVREMERTERDVAWLLLDASVDGWAGTPGVAPLDYAVEEVSAVAARHLARGDHVGLAVFASRPRTWIPPAGGPAQAALIAAALSGTSTMVDVDRSELDEVDVAARVAEHLRPLTRESIARHAALDLDRLAIIAENVRGRAPFEARVPYAPTPRERTLRHYLACFGIECPPKEDGERARAESELARILSNLNEVRPRPSIVHVWAPAPTLHGLVARAVRVLRRRRTALRWNVPQTLPSLNALRGASPVARSMDEAMRVRARAEEARGNAALRTLGIERGAALPRTDPDSTRGGHPRPVRLPVS